MFKIGRIIQKVANSRDPVFFVLSQTGIYKSMDDSKYLTRFFKSRMPYDLNLDSPETFNEKIQWLKLHDRNPLYTELVDKIAVKGYIASAVGDQCNVPLLGVYDDPSEIDFDSLPDQFVLKCNHNSHYGISICRDRSRFDQRKAVASLRRALKQNYYYAGREWPYKNVKPRVLAEKLLVDESNPLGGITDYKFFCFNGEVDSVMVCTERNTGKPKFYFFSKEWNLKRYNKSSLGLPSNFKIVKPRNVDAMFDLASALSRNIPFVRIDLYSVGGKIYFGEFTFYPNCGVDSNILHDADVALGSKINLSIAYKGVGK